MLRFLPNSHSDRLGGDSDRLGGGRGGANLRPPHDSARRPEPTAFAPPRSRAAAAAAALARRHARRDQRPVPPSTRRRGS